MRLMPIEKVKSNTVLGKTLYDIEGRLLLRSGVVLKDNMIQKIKESNILSVYIIDKYSREEIEDVIKPQIRQKAIRTIKEFYLAIEANNKKPAKDFNLRKEIHLKKIDELIKEIIDEIVDNEGKMLSLVDIRSMNNYIYSHSVNVAVISVMIGRALKLTYSNLEKLCMGALLHDIGKLFIPAELLMKENLTKDEELKVESHCRNGYKFLSEIYTMSAVSKLAVLQHHERPDGTGYPDKLKIDKISEFSKIIAVADGYDNLSTDLPNKRAMFPSDVVEYLMSNAGTMYDYDIVHTFVNEVVLPFPHGTLVDLSNGETAVVEDTRRNFPLRPIIRIIKSDNPDRIDEEINLIEELSMVVSSIRYEID